jgi:hypothetical protein
MLEKANERVESLRGNIDEHAVGVTELAASAIEPKTAELESLWAIEIHGGRLYRGRIAPLGRSPNRRTPRSRANSVGPR